MSRFISGIWSCISALSLVCAYCPRRILTAGNMYTVTKFFFAIEPNLVTLESDLHLTISHPDWRRPTRKRQCARRLAPLQLSNNRRGKRYGDRALNATMMSHAAHMESGSKWSVECMTQRPWTA